MNTPMRPPWLVYPEIEPHSIGWRMGRGEDYYNKFYKWFSSLTPTERSAFVAAYPEALGWEGLYKMISDEPWL